MKWHRILCTALVILLPCAGRAQNAAPRVYSDAGNIFFERNGAKTALKAEYESWKGAG